MVPLGIGRPRATVYTRDRALSENGARRRRRVEDGWFRLWERDQDDAVISSQGRIADRGREHLGVSDQGVILYRKMLKRAIADVKKGKDPKAVIRDPKQDQVIVFDAYKSGLGAEPGACVRATRARRLLSSRHMNNRAGSAMLKAGFAAGLAAIVAVPALAQAPLKLGVLNELSGPFGPSGTPQRDGFLLYLKEHGQKLGGRPVETVIEDTAGDPATGLNKAKKLAEADKIDILVGPLSSAVGVAIKSYVVSQKLPTFLCSTVDEVGDGKYIFRLSFTGYADSFLQGYLAGKAGFKRAVTVAPDYIAGQTAAEWFEKGFKAAGGTVVRSSCRAWGCRIMARPSRPSIPPRTC